MEQEKEVDTLKKELKYIKKLAALLVIWHKRHVTKYLKEKIRKSEFDIPEHMAVYMKNVNEAIKLDLGVPRLLYALGWWQVGGPLETFYQSSIYEEIKRTDKLDLLIARAERSDTRFGGNERRLGDIGSMIKSCIVANYPDAWWQSCEFIPSCDNNYIMPAKPEPEPEPEPEPGPIVWNDGVYRGKWGKSIQNRSRTMPQKEIHKPAPIQDLGLPEQFRKYDVHLEKNVGGARVITDINRDLGNRHKGKLHTPESFGFVDASREEGIVKQTLEGRLVIKEVILGAPGAGLSVLIHIQNPSGVDLATRIPAGTVFEVVEPGQHVQNVVMAEAKILNIVANEEVRVTASGRCLNQSRSTPNGQKGRLTRFRFDQKDLSQDAVWETMGNPVNN